MLFRHWSKDQLFPPPYDMGVSSVWACCVPRTSCVKMYRRRCLWRPFLSPPDFHLLPVADHSWPEGQAQVFPQNLRSEGRVVVTWCGVVHAWKKMCLHLRVRFVCFVMIVSAQGSIVEVSCDSLSVQCACCVVCSAGRDCSLVVTW